MTPEWEGPVTFACMVAVLIMGIAYGRLTA
jgi:hypothetical protein